MLIIRISWQTQNENEDTMKFGNIMENVVSIRGAITVKKNNKEEMQAAIRHLLTKIFKENDLKKTKIINIIFTVTHDINAANPATITREHLKLGSIPMLCVQEMKVKNGMPRCIRILIQAYCTRKAKHVYLGKASGLRPDLTM